MSITDELRKIAAKTECASGRCEKLYRGDLDHAADRIDERIEREYVKLPVDADGVPIHVGDEMEWPDGSTFDVVGISANTLFYVERDFDDSAQWTAAHNKRHHQPDTWERIIEDAVNDEAGVWFHTASEASRYIEQRKTELVERCKRLAGEA